ncbi:MAG: hypothetical protein H5T70_09060 [Chloroflexi bacterium]|nr:hypothetical protein [Chloroflexota bacterium]MBC7316551.1 hypothetical protein [Chloroflexota bacterium]
MKIREALPAQEAGQIREMARQVAARGLAVPAIMALELLKPWNFVGSQLMWLAEPLLGPRARRYATFLEDRRRLDALLNALTSPHSPPEGGEGDRS